MLPLELPTADFTRLQLSQGLNWFRKFIPKPQLDFATSISYPAFYHGHLWSLPQMQTTPLSLMLVLSISFLVTCSFTIRWPHKSCGLPNHLPTGTLHLPPTSAETEFSTDDTTSPVGSAHSPTPHIHPSQEVGQHFTHSQFITSLPSEKAPAILR